MILDKLFKSENTIKNYSDKEKKDFIETFHGSCNFLIFAESISLRFDKQINFSEYIHKENVINFFNYFEEIFSFGISMNLFSLNNKIIRQTYFVSLSKLYLNFKFQKNIAEEKEDFLHNLKEMITGNNSCDIKNKNKEFNSDNESIEALINHSNLNLYCFQLDENTSIEIYDEQENERLIINYNENMPYFKRKDFIEIILNIFIKLGLNDKLKLSHLDSNLSYFTLYFSPLKSNCSSVFDKSSFLVKYNFPSLDFVNDDNSYFENFYELPVIGILPIDLIENIWLSKINYISNKNFFLERNAIFIDLLEDSIRNFHEICPFKNEQDAKESYDYNKYLKSEQNKLLKLHSFK